MLPIELTDATWVKNWSGNWTFLFASFYGDIYTAGLQNFVGGSFVLNLISLENGSSVNYLSREELKRYSLHLTDLVLKKKELVDEWSHVVFTKTDDLLSLISDFDTRPQLGAPEYYVLKSAMYALTPANFAVKRVADYLPAKLSEELLPKLNRVRAYTESVYNETDRMLRKILEPIAVHHSFAPELLYVATKEEVENYFEHEALPLNLPIRQKGCAIFYHNSPNGLLIQGDDFTALQACIVGKLSAQDIQGTPAYKGKVTGIVRTILNPKTVVVFNEGDILVAGMTQPEYLPLMKKAAAFVTDAGGILSHAAIVAREMKKPCIVGTEIATQVLKDGDLVEVDAENGVVKVLKQQS